VAGTALAPLPRCERHLFYGVGNLSRRLPLEVVDCAGTQACELGYLVDAQSIGKLTTSGEGSWDTLSKPSRDLIRVGLGRCR
jgi:hypothetical protein